MIVNIALIGTGNWGKNLVRTFYNLDSSNLAICCDIDDERLAPVRKNYPKTGTTKNIDDILSNPDIHGVVVSSSAVTHAEIAKKVLLSGKHVYIEKPLSLNMKDARALISLSGKMNRKIMVGHLLLYHPAVRKLKQIIDEGETGEIYYIYSRRLNLGIIRKEENALWSFAPHDISVILYLMGEEPLAVSCHGGAYLQDGIEDVVFVDLQFKNRRMAHIHLSWLDPEKTRKTIVVGSRKMAVFDDLEPVNKIRIYDKGADVRTGYGISARDGGVSTPAVEMKEPLELECRHFIDCIRNNEEPFTNGENGLQVVRVLESAQKSLENKGRMEEIKR